MNIYTIRKATRTIQGGLVESTYTVYENQSLVSRNGDLSGAREFILIAKAVAKAFA